MAPNAGKGRWLNFVYMLVAVVLVSVTIIVVGFYMKTCIVDSSLKNPPSPDSIATGAITPYQLPRIAVTAASVSPALRNPPALGASFSAGKIEGRRRSDSHSVSALSEAALEGRDHSSACAARYNHLTVP